MHSETLQRKQRQSALAVEPMRLFSCLYAVGLQCARRGLKDMALTVLSLCVSKALKDDVAGLLKKKERKRKSKKSQTFIWKKPQLP